MNCENMPRKKNKPVDAGPSPVRLPCLLENLSWLHPNCLSSNSYNPNVVLQKELKLLELSIQKYGWLQPVLVTDKYEIIDGFHRVMISKKHNWLVPVVVMNISPIEQRLLTIRMNRAKGLHVALKMSVVYKELIALGASNEQIALGIGATQDELNLLSKDNVFQKFKFEGYSKAWTPGKTVKENTSQADADKEAE